LATVTLLRVRADDSDLERDEERDVESAFQQAIGA
jgi:hypothetical protein